MKSINLVATLPVAIAAIFLFTTNRRVRHGYALSKSRIEQRSLSDYERRLVKILEIGEDHRFGTHFGFDPTAIIRALYRTVICKRLEGASTIEQQYVRSCTGRSEISIARKIEEISIAVLISLTNKKEKVAYSYLAHAYFGEGVIGYRCAQKALANNPRTRCMGHEELSAIVAMLKHPMPKKPSGAWIHRHARRTRHIHQRMLVAIC